MGVDDWFPLIIFVLVCIDGILVVTTVSCNNILVIVHDIVISIFVGTIGLILLLLLLFLIFLFYIFSLICDCHHHHILKVVDILGV